MRRALHVGLAVTVCFFATGCGEPTTLDVTPSSVKDGKSAAYEFTLRNDGSRKFARDGIFSVTYVNGAGEVRCKGEGAVQAKDQRHDGELYVVINFTPPCTRVKSTSETKATYTFTPTKGKVLTYVSPFPGADLAEWDQTHLTEEKYAKEALALRPAVIAEVKRMAPLAALVPAPSGKRVACPPAVAAALQKAAPARVSYDDLLLLASRAPEPNHQDLGFTTSGVHTVMASSVKDPLYAAGDPRMLKFAPPAYVEVFRPSAWKRWVIVTEGEKHATFEEGSLSGDFSIIDVARHHVVCGGPISIQNDPKITGGWSGDSAASKNLAEKFAAARTALETSIAGGEIPATP
jgi:hypothetical protein